MRTLTLLLASLSFVSVSYAETPPESPDSGSGIVIPPLVRVVTEEHRDRAAGFLLRLKAAQLDRVQAERNQDERIERRTKHRVDCFLLLRDSDRFSRFNTASRCTTTQYTQNLEYLRKKIALWKTTEGISDEVRIAAEEKAFILIDAISAIMDGIETGVYSVIGQLIDVRHSLAELYRTPLWHAELQIRADRLRSWVAHFLVHLDTALQDSETSDNHLIVYQASHNCFADTDILLTNALAATDYNEAKTILEEAMTLLPQCTAFIRNFGVSEVLPTLEQTTEQNTESNKSEEAPEEPVVEPAPPTNPKWNRRLQRRQGDPVEYAPPQNRVSDEVIEELQQDPADKYDPTFYSRRLQRSLRYQFGE